MDILTELRSATAATHRGLELGWALLGPDLTRSGYEAFVCGLAGAVLDIAAQSACERVARTQRIARNSVQACDRARNWQNRDEALSA